jgi:hypothetical protein
LAGSLTFAYGLVALSAWLSVGSEALRAAAVASVACGFSAMIALVLTGLTTATPNAAAGTLAAMTVGMGVPLASAVAFGFSGWLVVCFEIALVLETLVAVSVVARYRRPTGTQAAPIS